MTEKANNPAQNYQQSGQSAETATQPAPSKESSDWLGGPQNGNETPSEAASLDRFPPWSLMTEDAKQRIWAAAKAASVDSDCLPTSFDDGIHKIYGLTCYVMVQNIGRVSESDAENLTQITVCCNKIVPTGA